MAYEMLEQQIKSLPYQYYMQVERFVNFMVHEAGKQAEEKYASAISISEKLKSVYSQIPSSAQTSLSAATLDSWRELTKNDTW